MDQENRIPITPNTKSGLNIEAGVVFFVLGWYARQIDQLSLEILKNQTKLEKGMLNFSWISLINNTLAGVVSDLDASEAEIKKVIKIYESLQNGVSELAADFNPEKFHEQVNDFLDILEATK